MAKLEHCRSCGAPVYWLRHVTTGKPAPINAEPVENGNIRINTYAGNYMLLAVGQRRDGSGGTVPEMLAGEKLHTNHFMTCPERRMWAKSGYHGKSGKRAQSQNGVRDG